MPLNTVYVGRPTKWGNPYKMTRTNDPHPCSREQAIEKYEQWLRGELVDRPDLLEPLRGKDLACWCPLNKSCHADVILKILEDMLSPEETKDVATAEKEIATGKAKTFKNVDDLLADLHRQG